MSAARLLGVVVPGIYLFALMWVPVLLRRAGRRSPRRPSEAAEGLAARQAEAAKRNALFHP